MLSPWRTAMPAPARHPDLEESLRLHGAVHTTGGRRLLGQRLAVADQRTQETRLLDPAGWTRHLTFTPSGLAIQGARAYAGLKNLDDPHRHDYSNVEQTPQTVRTVGRLYDQLPAHDPRAIGPYQAMRKEVADQHDFMTNRLGIRTQVVDHDPYSDVHEMMDDINKRNTLKVMGTHVTGGHPFFSDEENNQFRAVHDFFGHAATGRSFDRHGEQAAYLAHSQMFTPTARPALTTETKGQNSSLILNGHFPEQKVAMLPAQHWDERAVDLSQLPLTRAARREAAGRRRFNQDWEPIGGDYFPLDVINHYTQRKGTGFGDEKSEYNKQKPLSQQITERGYEKPVELITDGKSATVFDGHHRIDTARALGHTHVPVHVLWRNSSGYPDGAYDGKHEPWLKKWLTDMRGGRETVGRRTAERADKFEWERSFDGGGGWELIVRNPDGNPVRLVTKLPSGQRTAAGESWATLPHESKVSAAENIMENAGFAGKVFHVPTAYLKDAQERGMLDQHGHPDGRRLQREHSAEAEEFVNGVLQQHGHEGGIRVEPEHWNLREPGSGQALTDGYNYIGLAGNHANTLTLLHETAHILHGTTHRDGSREGHGPNFQKTLHGLYHEHLGPEAASIFSDILSP